MNPTTAKYLSQSFARDIEVQAARERRLALFRQGQAKDRQAAKLAATGKDPRPVGARARLAHAFSALWSPSRA